MGSGAIGMIAQLGDDRLGRHFLVQPVFEGGFYKSIENLLQQREGWPYDMGLQTIPSAINCATIIRWATFSARVSGAASPMRSR